MALVCAVSAEGPGDSTEDVLHKLVEEVPEDPERLVASWLACVCGLQEGPAALLACWSKLAR